MPYAPLIAPYIHPDPVEHWLGVPDLETGRILYWPWPIDSRSGLPVTEEMANWLFQHTDGAENDLMPGLPTKVYDEGDTEPDTLQRMADSGNTITGWFGADSFAVPLSALTQAQGAGGIMVWNRQLLRDKLGRSVAVARFESIPLDAALALLIDNASAATGKKLCQFLTANGCVPEPIPVTYEVYDVFESIQLTGGSAVTPPGGGTAPTPGPTTPTGPAYILRVEAIDCYTIAGFIIDVRNQGRPATVDIFINTVKVAAVTATRVRTDVASTYQTGSNATFGFVYTIPASQRVGKALSVRVYVHESSQEADYGVPTTTSACGSPPTDPVVTPPKLIQYRLDGPASLTKDQTKRYWVTEKYDNGSEVRSAKAITYSIVGGIPTGTRLSLSAQAGGAETDLTLNGTDKTQKIMLRADVAGGGSAEMQVEIVTDACARPANLAYKPMLVYNAVPAAGGNARLFDSLTDANQTLGKHFDGTAPLNLSGSTFPAEMADYNVGTEVFYRWGPAYTDCQHASDNIYYVLNGDGSNGQKIAIQVVNSRIAAVQRNAYQTPAPPTPTPNSSITKIGRMFLSGTNGARDVFYLAKNGVQPSPGAPVTGIAPTYGFKNLTTGYPDALNGNSEMYAVDSFDWPERWQSVKQAAQAAGYTWVTYANAGNAGEQIRFRFRGNASESVSLALDFDYVLPGDGESQPLTTLYSK